MIDEKLILKAAGAVTSSGNGTAIEIGNGLVKARMQIDVSALVVNDTTEIYEIHLMGGDDSDFTENVSLASLHLAAADADEDNIDSEATRYNLLVTNEKGGTRYPFVRVRHVIAGDTPSINYAAFLTEM